MQLAEKQELVRLLNLYKTDLIYDNDKNLKEKMRKLTGGEYKEFISGVKTQYKHARCITRKLEVEIEKELLSGYQLW